MPVGMSTNVEGVAEAIKMLKQIEPDYRKEFNKGMSAVVAPMLSEVKAGYPVLPASGMARPWNPKGYAIFPWDRAKVARGVKLKTSTRRGKSSVLYVSQGEPAGVLFEVPSARTLGPAFRASSPRLLWPAYDRHAGQIAKGVEGVLGIAVDRIAREMGHR